MRTVRFRAATAEEEDSIPTQLSLGPAWTQNTIFCQNPGFYLFAYF